MSSVAKFENLKDLIFELRAQSVLLDADVAEIYGVETKRINEAVKNDPDKFPVSKARRQFRLPWQSFKLSQKSDSYQEAFRSCRLLRTKPIRRHSCREAEN